MSFIGQHSPVSSSTIVRWLKCFMAEAGIDISIFKAHSARGALCSTAVGAGVTTKDILDAAEKVPSKDFTVGSLRRMTELNRLWHCSPII